MMYLFRRRNNEQHERDVLRHDVILFGVEPLTKRSQGEALLSAKGSRFSFGRPKKQRQSFVLRAEKKVYLPFERKRKRKRQRGHFPSCPLCKPQNSSHPRKRQASEREHSPPCLRGQKGNVNKRTNETGTSAHQKARRRS